MSWEEDFQRVYGEAPPSWMSALMGDPTIVKAPGETLEAFYIRKYGFQTATREQELQARIESYQATTGGYVPQIWLDELAALRKEPVQEPVGQTIYGAGAPGEGPAAVIVRTGEEALFKPEYLEQVKQLPGGGVEPTGGGVATVGILALAAMLLRGI